MYSFHYQYNSKLLLDLYEEKSLSLRKALGASNVNLLFLYLVNYFYVQSLHQSVQYAYNGFLAF